MFKVEHISKTYYLPKHQSDELTRHNGVSKSNVSFRNNSEDFHLYLDAQLLGTKEIITNNVKKYRNMPFFDNFHSTLSKLDVVFDFDNRELKFPKEILGLVRDSNFIIDDMYSQKLFKLKEDYYTSQYLYYTLFI